MGCDEEVRHQRKAEEKASNKAVHESKCIEMIAMSPTISYTLTLLISKGHLLLLPRHVPYFSSTNFSYITPRLLLTVPY